MSLILGIHFSKKLYLISDTRVTYRNDAGEIQDYEDGLIKTMPLSNYTALSAAGSARAASYLITRISERIGKESTIDEVFETFKRNLRPLVSEYVNNTGVDTGTVGLILAGFNPNNKKKIEASSIMDVLSKSVMPYKDRMVNQKVDTRLVNPIKSALAQGEKIKRGYTVEVDLESSAMYSFKIDIRTANINIEEVPCFSMVDFEPSKKAEMIQIPDEIISRIEAPVVGEEIGRASKNIEDYIYEETGYVLSFVQDHIEKRKFETVGGYLFPGIVMPLFENSPYFYFPAGTQAFLDFKTGKLKEVGDLKIIGGKFISTQKDGNMKEYQQLEDFIFKDGAAEIKGLEM